jgi:hypothetical protein
MLANVEHDLAAFTVEFWYQIVSNSVNCFEDVTCRRPLYALFHALRAVSIKIVPLCFDTRISLPPKQQLITFHAY